MLYPRAKIIVKQFEDLDADLRQMAVSHDEAFSIALGHNFFIALTLDTITSFEKSHSDIKIEKRFLSGSKYIDEAREGLVDIAYGPEPGDMDGLCYVPLVEEEPVVLLSKDSHLAKFDELLLSDLKDESFVFLMNEYSIKQYLITCCIKQGFTPKFCFEATDVNIIKGLIQSNQAIKLLPKFAVDTFEHDNITYIPLVHSDYLIKLGFVYCKERPLKGIAQEFIDYALERKPVSH